MDNNSPWSKAEKLPNYGPDKIQLLNSRKVPNFPLLAIEKLYMMY